MKERLLNLPFAGYVFKLVLLVARLPVRMGQIYKDLKDLHDRNLKLEAELEECRYALGKFNRVVERIEVKLDRAPPLGTVKNETSPGGEETQTFERKVSDRQFDAVYEEFENRFRGPREEVLTKLSSYLPYVLQAPKLSGEVKLIDVGCGRGEWLELMQRNKVSGYGLDINEEMVSLCQKMGFKAEVGDANDYLSRQPLESISALTGFHIVEHIELSELLRLLSSAYDCLAKDGIILFETPNPENIKVATHDFYTDPTHKNPIPPSTLSYLAGQIGFRKVEILRLREEKPACELQTPFEQWFADRFWVSPDYAILARK